MYSSFHLSLLPPTTPCSKLPSALKNMHSCILLPVNPPAYPPSSPHQSFPLTIHPSIHREGVESMVTVQSGVNWQTLPALLAWRGWVRKRTGRGGKETTAKGGAAGMERERPSVFTFSTFLSILLPLYPAIQCVSSLHLLYALIHLSNSPFH